MNELSKVSSIPESIDASKILRNDHHNYTNQGDLNTSLTNPIMKLEKVRSININNQNYPTHQNQHNYENQHRNMKQNENRFKGRPDF